MRKMEQAENIENNKRSAGNPQTEKHFARENTPAENKVYIAYELKRKGDFKKAHDNLEVVHPTAGFRQCRHCRGKHRQQEERGCKNDGKPEHTDNRVQEFTFA